MNNAFLYLATTIIWGSTWLAIKLQLGTVSPELSVAYRMGLAAVLLLIYSRFLGLNLSFTRRRHAFIALQGFLLFSINYLLVYLAEFYLIGGLVALIFSMIVIFNVFFAAVLLGDKVRRNVLAGGLVGLVGLAFIFWPELSNFSLAGGVTLGIGLALASVISASLGNIVAARNQRHDLPVVQTNGFGMGYGALLMLVIALLRGTQLNFEATPSYVLSLLYLAIFGSIFGFGAFLTLLGRIGPDRAAYVTVLFPVVALGLSTLYEGLTWETNGVIGVALIIVGNVIALSSTQRLRRMLAGSRAAAEPQPAAD